MEWTFEEEDLAELELAQDPQEEDISQEGWDCWETVLDVEGCDFETRQAAAERALQLAEEGDGWAQYVCGWLYEDGSILTLDNYKAMQYYDEAVGQGIAEAYLALGKLYLSGDREVADPWEGVRLLKKLARAGNPFAAYRLGKEYITGYYVEKDWDKAKYWLRQAAKAYHAPAQLVLAKLCLRSDEVDEGSAYEHLKDAAWNGSRYADALSQRAMDYRTAAAFLGTCRLLAEIGQIFQEHTMLPSSDEKIRIDPKRIRNSKLKMRGHNVRNREDYGPTW